MSPPQVTGGRGKLRQIAGTVHAKIAYVTRTPYQSASAEIFRLVAVPGINTLRPEDWVDSKGTSWLRVILSQSASERVLYTFDHAIGDSEAFSWQSLLDKGNDLLTCLLELTKVVSYLHDASQKSVRKDESSFPLSRVGHTRFFL